jgi:hypothetical protein
MSRVFHALCISQEIRILGIKRGSEGVSVERLLPLLIGGSVAMAAVRCCWKRAWLNKIVTLNLSIAWAKWRSDTKLKVVRATNFVSIMLAACSLLRCGAREQYSARQSEECKDNGSGGPDTQTSQPTRITHIFNSSQIGPKSAAKQSRGKKSVESSD